MPFRSAAGCIALVLTLAACAKPPPAPPPVAAPAVPLAVELPQVGHFSGTLPCNGCDGVRTDLLLAGNWEGVQRYHLRETYIGGAQNSRTVEREGAWVKLRGVPEDETATVYQLDPDAPGQRRHFIVVDERSIRLLDDALEPIGEPLVRVDTR